MDLKCLTKLDTMLYKLIKKTVLRLQKVYLKETDFRKLSKERIKEV